MPLKSSLTKRARERADQPADEQADEAGQQVERRVTLGLQGRVGVGNLTVHGWRSLREAGSAIGIARAWRGHFKNFMLVIMALNVGPKRFMPA